MLWLFLGCMALWATCFYLGIGDGWVHALLILAAAFVVVTLFKKPPPE